MTTLYDNYINLLQTTNFIGGGGQDELPEISGDSRTIVNLSSGKYQLYYMTLLVEQDLIDLGYYATGLIGADREYSELPSGNDPSLTLNQMNALYDILHADYANTYSVSFEDVANIEFNVGGASTAHIIYGSTTNGGTSPQIEIDSNDAAYEMDNSSGWGSLKHGDIWINQEALADQNTSPTNFWSNTDIGSLGYWGLMHETAHALGLDDAATNYSTVLNTQKYTIMSYIPANGMGALGSSDTVTPFGLQLMDIAALQEIYGRNYDTRNTNTTYSAATAFASSRPNDAFIYTIWDGGGTDTIDASGYVNPVEIDLRQGRFSSIGRNAENGAAVDNLAIAYHAVIENAIGTNGADLLLGNDWSNELHGGGGDDLIYGNGYDYDSVLPFLDADASDLSSPNWNVPLSDDDIIYGGAGEDHLYGGSGVDYVYGGDNNDYLFGGEGNDTLYGDSGSDDLTGGSGDDTIYGGDGDDYVWALFDEVSNSSFNGGDGEDTIHFLNWSLYSNLIINLAAGTITSNNSSVAAIQYITGIENVIAGEYHRVIGDHNNNIISFWRGYAAGGDGDDIYKVGDYAYIVEDAGEGNDTVIVGSLPFGLSFDVEGDFYDNQYFVIKGIETEFDSLTGQLRNDLDFELRIEIESFANPEFSIENFYFGDFLITKSQIADLIDDVWNIDIFNSNYQSSFYSNVLDSYQFDLRDIEDYITNNTIPVPVSGFNGISLSRNTLGEIDSIKTDPSLGLNWIDAAHGSEALHPWIVTAFSGGPGYSTMTYESFVKEIGLNSAVSLDDIHITADGNTTGYASLNITIGSSFSFTIPDFEAGKTINGIAVFDGVIYDSIAEAASSTLQRTGTGTYSATYDKDIGILAASITETYFFEKLNYGNGSIDMTGTLTFNGTNGADTIHGLNTRGDIMQGNEGIDHLYSYGGNDTLIGGADDDNLTGGAGDDIYVVDTGEGADYVTELTDEGEDTIRLLNIDAADVRLFTDQSGTLYLEDKNNPSNKVTIYAGTEGSYESTVRNYVEQVIFDDTTVWDLTGALTLEGTSSMSYDYLYGTQFDDTLLGMAGTDFLSGNRGNDTLIGGANDDNLTGGEGADTFLFDTAALGSIDYINDFSFTDGDKLDISQLLFGYDPLTSLIDDFITMTDSSGNTDVSVDRDGAGTAYSSEAIAVIYYQTGMDADSMITNGNLIAA